MLSLNRPKLNWVEMAQSMGAKACRVNDCGDLAPAIESGLQTPGPYLIEVTV